MFNTVQAEYTGERKVPARVMIHHNGHVYNGQGYIFGGGRNLATMTKVEADILTGAVAPVVEPETGKVVTGFVIHMNLGKAGLSGESWRIKESEALA
jgi:hypothetical protein